MSRDYRLTRRAQASLIDIARWTYDSFGARQAELYQDELLDRCRAIVAGQAHSRSCALLMPGAKDLKYVRAGEHYLVYLDQPDQVIIIDIVHGRSDLPAHIARLSAAPEG